MTQNLAARLGRQGRMSEAELRQFHLASRLLPGGALGGNALPEDAKFVFSHGKGGRFWDTSGNEYIDYCLGSGSLFLGHAHPAIVRAVTDQAVKGTHFFAYLNEAALRLAEKFCALVPCAERVRFTTSGSDSTFHAIRLARAFTRKKKILKFEGAYHGVHDYAQLSTAPKQAADFPRGHPDTEGIPQEVQDLMLVAPFNDLEATRKIVAEHAHELAAVIVEPIQRIIMPKPGFLEGLRTLTAAHDVLLILDEVVTGFRYGLGGAQQLFGIKPDLATYGKIIGSGLPVGAVAGRADIMDQANPSNKGKAGYVYQNGTLQGHCLGAAAGLAAIDTLSQAGVYERVNRLADDLRRAVQQVVDRHGMKVLVFGYGPMWHMLFTDREPTCYADIRAADGASLLRLERELIRQGLFVLPGNRRFVSIAHTEADLEDSLPAIDMACREFLKR